MNVPETLTEQDHDRIARLPIDRLTELYRFIKEQIKTQRPIDLDNMNVMSVRLPLSTVTNITALAFARRETRSAIVRKAIHDYTRPSNERTQT